MSSVAVAAATAPPSMAVERLRDTGLAVAPAQQRLHFGMDIRRRPAPPRWGAAIESINVAEGAVSVAAPAPQYGTAAPCKPDAGAAGKRQGIKITDCTTRRIDHAFLSLPPHEPSDTSGITTRAEVKEGHFRFSPDDAVDTTVGRHKVFTGKRRVKSIGNHRHVTLRGNRGKHGKNRRGVLPAVDEMHSQHVVVTPAHGRNGCRKIIRSGSAVKKFRLDAVAVELMEELACKLYLDYDVQAITIGGLDAEGREVLDFADTIACSPASPPSG